MKDTVVLYHGDCPDGFGGAWAAYKKFGDKAEYIGVHHQFPPPEGLNDREIYFVDFIYNDEELVKKIVKENKKVIVIDHHSSAEKNVKLGHDYLYNIDNSGSVLAWEYFHPNENVPKILKYIEDRDLYRFNLPHSRAVCVYIDSFDHKFEAWDSLASDIENEDTFDKAIEKGEVIVKYESELVKNIIKESARLVVFEGYETYAVNAPSEFASDIGAELCKIKPPIAIIWRQNSKTTTISLRSDGTVDVSELAGKFGGGGHKSSSGFRIDMVNSFPWKEI